MSAGKKKLNLGIIAFLAVLCASFYFYGTFYSKVIVNKTESLASPIVVEEIKKEISVGEDLLGSAQVSFLGSTEGRGKNIELGISRINESIIMPGEEFSFSETMGEVRSEDGFSEEKIFLNGEVARGLGGGLCQVSTTLFRSVLDAGLPVTERHNHSYSVSYYDVGLDATYSNPGPDLKFKNDTGNPIKIKGRVENQKAIFEIFGTHDGRVSSTTEPEITKIVDILPTKYVYKDKLEEGQTECINAPQIGYTAEIKYNVAFPNGENREQIFTSKYNPLQRICFIVGLEGLKKFNSNLQPNI